MLHTNWFQFLAPAHVRKHNKKHNGTEQNTIEARKKKKYQVRNRIPSPPILPNQHLLQYTLDQVKHLTDQSPAQKDVIDNCPTQYKLCAKDYSWSLAKSCFSMPQFGSE
jgi:hypothetical protein